jgi:hypothetical protein
MKENDLERMLSQQGRRLDHIYDDIGDYLEAVDWVPADVLSGVRILVERAQTEPDGPALESLLNALIKAVSRGKPLPPEIFEPIVSTLSRLPVDLLGYAFEVLAQTHHRPFEPAIRQYLAHTAQRVREAADAALVELAGRAPRMGDGRA